MFISSGWLDAAQQKHIIISYDPDVKEQVREFRRRLEREGYEVWVHEERLTPDPTTGEVTVSKYAMIFLFVWV